MENTIQDNVKPKTSYDFKPTVKLAVLLITIIWPFIFKAYWDRGIESLSNIKKYFGSLGTVESERYSTDLLICFLLLVFFCLIISQIYLFVQDRKEKKKLKAANLATEAHYKEELRQLKDFNKEQKTEDERRHEELKGLNTHLEEKNRSLILNAPNRAIFGAYSIIWDRLYNTLKSFERQNEQSTKPIEKILENYQNLFLEVFEKISELTLRFSNKNDAIFGCNVMCFIPLRADSKEYIDRLRNDSPNWLHFKEEKNILGILQIFPELIHTGDRNRKIPAVILPVLPSSPENIDILPGALRAALISKGISIVKNTEIEYEKDFARTPEKVKSEAKYFFNNAGKDIKSFVSIKIPVTDLPIKPKQNSQNTAILGVLNIDCNEKNLLGEEDEFAITYYALIKPIVYLLAPYLAKYFHYYKTKNKFEFAQ